MVEDVLWKHFMYKKNIRKKILKILYAKKLNKEGPFSPGQYDNAAVNNLRQFTTYHWFNLPD